MRGAPTPSLAPERQSKRARQKRSAACCRLFLFAPARSREEMHDVVVIFVTRVLVHLLTGIDLSPWNSRRPRSGPCFRILDRKFVSERIRARAGEALRDAERFRIGALENHAVVRAEIRRLDHERIALPMAARVAQPLMQVLTDMRAPVHRNDSGAVDHLRRDNDKA